MKKQKSFTRKLVFNKNTIANLNREELNGYKAGATTLICMTPINCPHTYNPEICPNTTNDPNCP